MVPAWLPYTAGDDVAAGAPSVAIGRAQDPDATVGPVAVETAEEVCAHALGDRGTPEQQAFRQEFRAWLHDSLPGGWMEAADRGDDATLETIKADSRFNPFAWQGTIGRSPYAAPLWPKEYGGLSGEVWMQQVIRTELVRYRLPTVSIDLLGVGLAGPTLIEHGTEEQKERYLRKILSGEEIWCQLFSEPGSGSDLASLATRASATATSRW